MSLPPEQRYGRGCLLLAILATLVGCKAPTSGPAASPLRLPTRIYHTPTPIPTPTVTPIAAQKYYEEGIARQAGGDATGAMQSFSWAIQQAPDFAPAYAARSTLYLAQGKLHLALAQADAALEADPTLASAYALRGETLRLMGDVQPALDAFDQAVDLDPDLKAATFPSHWAIARAAGRPVRLLTLSSEYANIYADDPLRHYYRGWAFVEMGQGSAAARILIEGIHSTPEAPALLWFALGEAYAVGQDWEEAVTAFEATRVLVQTGDTSLALHSEQPIVDLFVALGRAYLGTGRCVDAEAMLLYALEIGAPASELTGMLEEAHTCSTPTPTGEPVPTLTLPENYGT